MKITEDNCRERILKILMSNAEESDDIKELRTNSIDNTYILIVNIERCIFCGKEKK